MSDKPDAGEWRYIDRTLQLLAVHCGTVAYEEDGGWLCAVCPEFTRARDIPGWLDRLAQLRPGQRITRGASQ